MLRSPREALAYASEARGRDKSAAINDTETRWNIAPWCEKPVRIEMNGAKDAKYDTLPSHYTYFLAACGKCQRCRYKTYRQWCERATSECSAANRTWFLTLTADLPTQERWQTEALEGLRRRGWSDADLASDPTTMFRARTQAAGRDVTKYFKRLRKSGRALRYVLCWEAHNSGLPHAHALVHEIGPVPLRKRDLQSQWSQHGFSSAKLVSHAESPHYVLKALRYLTKDLGGLSGRVRSSIRYGDPLAQAPLGIAKREKNNLIVSKDSKSHLLLLKKEEHGGLRLSHDDGDSHGTTGTE